MFDQTFGVEIEAAGPFPTILTKQLVDLGCVKPSLGYNLTLPGHPSWLFEVKADGSVAGSEITTPPMTENELGCLKHLVVMLQGMNMRGSKNCGLHVHVGLGRRYGNSETFSALKDIIYHNWTAIKPKMYKAWRPLPGREHFCKMEFSRSDMSFDRYLAVNCTRSHHNTIEFRLFNGHLHWRWICRAIRFSCGFMKLCKMGHLIQDVLQEESVEDVLRRTLKDSLPVEEMVS